MDNNKTCSRLKDDELELVTGGIKRKTDNICPCGRGVVYKDGKCKHCFLLSENA